MVGIAVTYKKSQHVLGEMALYPHTKGPLLILAIISANMSWLYVSIVDRKGLYVGKALNACA